MGFVELSDSFPALWESPYLYYLLQAFKASVLGSTHILTLRVLSKLSSAVWWGRIPLPHRRLNDVLFQDCRDVYWYTSFLWCLKCLCLLALLLSCLSLFGCCSVRNPGNVVTRLLLVFHLVHSGVPTQFKTVWSQFNIIPLTYYSRVSLTASCRKLLCWTEIHVSNGAWHVSVNDRHTPVYAPVNNPFPCVRLHVSCVSLEYPCSQEDHL